MDNERQEALDNMRDQFAISVESYGQFLRAIYTASVNQTNTIINFEDMLNEFCDRYEKKLSLQDLYEQSCVLLSREIKVSEDNV